MGDPPDLAPVTELGTPILMDDSSSVGSLDSVEERRQLEEEIRLSDLRNGHLRPEEHSCSPLPTVPNSCMAVPRDMAVSDGMGPSRNSGEVAGFSAKSSSFLDLPCDAQLVGRKSDTHVSSLHGKGEGDKVAVEIMGEDLLDLDASPMPDNFGADVSGESLHAMHPFTRSKNTAPTYPGPPLIQPLSAFSSDEIAAMDTLESLDVDMVEGPTLCPKSNGHVLHGGDRVFVVGDGTHLNCKVAVDPSPHNDVHPSIANL